MSSSVPINASASPRAQVPAPGTTSSANAPLPGASQDRATLEIIVFIVVACLVGLGYSLYTGQIWEDTLITLRHSENLLRGEGLVYNAGERIHGFTSPINVLLLALCHLLTGQTSHVATLWLYRVFSIAAFAAGGAFLLRAMNKVAPRWSPAVWILGVLYLFDSKGVAYSTDGMETAFMLFFVGWAIDLLARAASDRWLARGLCWAGLLWGRPDGFVYIAALVGAELMFFGCRPWRGTFESLAKSAAICALAYGPWFAWAWWYYGSPIPQTVTAKAHFDDGRLAQIIGAFERLPDSLLFVAGRILRPIQSGPYDTWVLSEVGTHALVLVTNLLGAIALLYWVFPVRDPLGRAASFCYALLSLYFSFHFTPSLWYYPPTAVFCLVAVARALTMLATGEFGLQGALARRVLTAAVAMLAVGQVMVFLANAYADRVFQREIEDGQRTVIGTWLKENGRAGQSVYLEPLGYIGYFSGLRMLDYPGLVSPDVVRLRREKRSNDVITELSPDWVVLRYDEAKRLLASPLAERFKSDYQLERRFDVNDKINQYGSIHELALVRYDAAFAVFRRKASVTAAPSTLPTPPALPPQN